LRWTFNAAVTICRQSRRECGTPDARLGEGFDAVAVAADGGAEVAVKQHHPPLRPTAHYLQFFRSLNFCLKEINHTIRSLLP
jgi:hypothetical protein